MRGGRTKLAHLTAPQAEYQHETKGDALHAMELALSLEKLNFQKLRHLHDVAEESKDAQMSDFVEDMLADQVCTLQMCFLLQLQAYVSIVEVDMLIVAWQYHKNKVVVLSCGTTLLCIVLVMLCSVEYHSHEICHYPFTCNLCCCKGLLKLIYTSLSQAKEVKEVADYVAQLRRIGKGHGVFHFDQVMAEDATRLATPSSQYTT